jgi:hypothetical protein
MRPIALAVLLLGGCATGAPHRDRSQDAIERIHEAVLAGNDAHAKLIELCDDVGHRLSGSPQLDRAIEWAVARLKADGHENVRAEKVMVPKWVRGRESLAMIEPREHPMPMLGLGGSVATPADGITAEVVVVRDKAELDNLPTAEGKIVLFNCAMPPYDPEKGPRYGETVAYRANGAVWAAEKGAVAALVRSVTAKSLRTPHTGGMRYAEGKPKIPAGAVTIEDAELMARLVARGKKVVVKLMMEAKTEPDAPSANVVAELRGREKPDEVVIISGHLDTWDVGQGAQDDGGGCVMAMEALRTLRRLNLVPRRTIRVVLWTNEENGMAGVRGYLEAHEKELPLHVAAIESDSGTFEPEGFGIDLQDPERLKAAAALLKERLPRYDIKAGESAPDVGHFKAKGVPCIGLRVDRSTYFDYHHTPADTVDKVDPKILSKCTAAMAAAAYAIAEMPGRLDGK